MFDARDVLTGEAVAFRVYVETRFEGFGRFGGFARCGSTVRGFYGLGVLRVRRRQARPIREDAKRVPVRYDGRATAGENVSHGGSERA
jgi:hypothetical protein